MTHPGDQPTDPAQVDLRGGHANEPTIILRRPPGWEIRRDSDTPLVRGVLYNQELRRHGFTPNAVVTVEDLTGRVGLPAQALARERAAVTAVVGELDTDVAGTVSGFPSRTITYNMQGRPATGLIVAAQDIHDRIWAITLTMQTADPDNTGYLTAKQTLLDSLEVRLPTA